MSSLKTKLVVDKIFNQAKQGVVKIGDEKYPWVFHTKFFADIENASNTTNSGYPVIKITNYALFLDLIEEYFLVAKKFYSRDEEYFDLEKNTDFEEKLFLDLMINATPKDMQNILGYIKTRTEMLKTPLETGRLDLGEFNGFKVTGVVTKRWSNLESPFRFIPEFFDPVSKTTFTLPTITFGIVDGVAQVGAIQNENPNQTAPAAKKLDRYFRKVNKDVDPEDIIYNISPNALVSFTMFVSYLENLGVKKIESSPFQPIRYNSQKAGKYVYAKSQEAINKIADEMNRNQFNATNKVLYTLLRYAHHFSNTEAYFDENTQTMHLHFSNLPSIKTDNIIYDIANIGKNTSFNLISTKERWFKYLVKQQKRGFKQTSFYFYVVIN